MKNIYFSQKRKNKFGAKGTKYNGRYYDSMLEANYAQQLDWEIKAGIIKEWIPQFKIDLSVNGVHIANYYVDFKVIKPDNSIEFHEVKGCETDLWRMKWKLTQALLDQIEPGAKLVLIK